MRDEMGRKELSSRHIDFGVAANKSATSAVKR